MSDFPGATPVPPLERSVQFLKSIGPKRAEFFARAGLRTIRDVLFYFPTRHLDRSNLLNSQQAYSFVMNGFEGEITVIGKVVQTDIHYGRGRDILVVQFRDQTGFFECVWYQGIKYFENKFRDEEYFAISGKPKVSKMGALQFEHPDSDLLSSDESQGFFSTGKIIPFYRIPKELRSANVGDISIRKVVSYAMDGYLSCVEETLTAPLIAKYHLPPIQQLVATMHFPESKDKLSLARQRLKFEELFYLELLVAIRKANFKLKIKGHSIQPRTELVRDFISALPFELTKAQRVALREIHEDLRRPEPMNRLLQGDVGSGKTITALIAMLSAVDSGFQAVLMAPTEILADQHFRSINKLLQSFLEKFPQYKLNTALLLGGQTKKRRRAELENIGSQEADIIIGTHALFEGGVSFKNLGMAVIDEQHRFGVAQRAKLIEKGSAPDCLFMSATPIPRTLSLTVYGDLDVSIINEMPKNRIPIQTYLRGEIAFEKICAFIADKAREGYQSFIVYPLVEESEKVELKAAQKYFETLSETYLKGLRLGLIHGRMKWTEKEDVMLRFAAKEFDVLVATTVIEVGIDIPDANIMVINDAHHFGLSQLHQLRGRIGRGTVPSYCILVAPDEVVAASAKIQDKLEYLSPQLMEKYRASVRLQTMIKHLDGFRVAEIDLKLRGPGDIFGTRQSGFPDLKYADISEDLELLVTAKNEAFAVISRDPRLLSAEHSPLRKNLLTHYSENLKFAKIA